MANIFSKGKTTNLKSKKTRGAATPLLYVKGFISCLITRCRKGIYKSFQYFMYP